MLLDKFKASNAWDQEYDLPLVPMHNNPWIYGAYATLLLDLTDRVTLEERWKAHFTRCRVEGTGLFKRWPDGRGGTNSHDEIMGAAFVSPWIAEQILEYLDSQDGYFNDTGEQATVPEQFNVYRMPFLRPYLQACTRRRLVSLISETTWSAHMLFDAFTHKSDDAGGLLRNWLMTYRVRGVIATPVAWFWNWRVGKLMTPAQAFAREPAECPVYAENAPAAW